MPHAVVVKAPASTANVGPGFDVFGLALDFSYDEVRVELAEEGVRLSVTGSFSREVPSDPNRNCVGVVARAFLERFGLSSGVSIELKKEVRPRCGLGSSGASSVATALALRELFGVKLETRELLEIASEGERAASGAAHVDNIAASLLGGFTIVYSTNPLKVFRIMPPQHLKVAIVIPEIELPERKTEVLRTLVPQTVPLSKLVNNVAKAAATALGFLLGDEELLSAASYDEVAEPGRAELYGYLRGVKSRALDSGAIFSALSGAGPSVIALVDSRKGDHGDVGREMQRCLGEMGIRSELLLSGISNGPIVDMLKS
jgi:homoserine kinase